MVNDMTFYYSSHDRVNNGDYTSDNIFDKACINAEHFRDNANTTIFYTEIEDNDADEYCIKMSYALAKELQFKLCGIIAEFENAAELRGVALL